MNSDTELTKAIDNVLISSPVLPSTEEAETWPQANIGIRFSPAVRGKSAAELLGMIPDDITHLDKQTDWDAGVVLTGFNGSYVVESYGIGFVNVFNGNIRYATVEAKPGEDSLGR